LLVKLMINVELKKYTYYLKSDVGVVYPVPPCDELES
jgi:hypothetical protein